MNPSLNERKADMQSCPIPVVPNTTRTRPRTALIASADGNFRQRLNEILTGLRWQVREASGGADAWTQAEAALPEAVIVDSWLPDLSCADFLKEFRLSFPEVALLSVDGAPSDEGPRGPHRQELLYALRRIQETDDAAWKVAPNIPQETPAARGTPHERDEVSDRSLFCRAAKGSFRNGIANPPDTGPTAVFEQKNSEPEERTTTSAGVRLPEFVGEAPCILEVSRRIRLVAGRSTPVLIEGPTGSGKELVAEALHRLSTRSRKPLVAINCAAIPEALLEAELFGHTRGAFTGAVQGRVGRIEAADGGTLFLDEIGEMPLSLQAKLLRFVESGELQRVGDNENMKVDVRIVAATHQPLSHHTQTGAFRADLYYRLAVFLIRTPALDGHLEDLPALVEHFLAQMGREAPLKQIDSTALAKLAAHPWPGNVRELEHVLERAAILAGDAPVITAQEIDFGLAVD
jgi:DNA-binding NtrC family response regulator